MIDEIPAYVAAVNMATNKFWNNVEGARESDENRKNEQRRSREIWQ